MPTPSPNSFDARHHPLGPRCLQRCAAPACALLGLWQQGSDATDSGLGRFGVRIGAVPGIAIAKHNDPSTRCRARDTLHTICGIAQTFDAAGRKQFLESPVVPAADAVASTRGNGRWRAPGHSRSARLARRARRKKPRRPVLHEGALAITHHVLGLSGSVQQRPAVCLIPQPSVFTTSAFTSLRWWLAPSLRPSRAARNAAGHVRACPDRDLSRASQTSRPNVTRERPRRWSSASDNRASCS